MTEWQLLEGEEIVGSSAPYRTRSRWIRHWPWLAGSVILLLASVFFTIRAQRLAQRAAILADITSHVVEEETVRYLGQVDRASELIVPNAPEFWQQAYIQTFNISGYHSPIDDIKIKTLEFDGRCAIMTVTLNDLEQYRNYCLHRQQWRRAPVPAAAWGSQQTIIYLGQGVRLKFSPRDRAFAETLARDLRRYLKEYDRWLLTLNQEESKEDRFPIEIEIVIEPHDMYDALIQAKPGRIVLNSPSLVPVDGTLSGEATVRQALAEAIFRPGRQMARLQQPLETTLLHFEPKPNGGGVAYVDQPGRGDPLPVEIPPGLTFNTSSNAFVPPGCTPPGTSLEISRGWLDFPQRAQANKVIAQKITPLAIEPAPPETVAYLLSGEPMAPQAMIALSQDGQQHRLTDLDADLRVYPLAVAPGEETHFLFRLDLPTCERSWFIHYEPGQRISEYWLAPSSRVQWVWRASHDDLILTSPREDSPGFRLYRTLQSLTFEPIGQSDPPLLFLGWHTATDRPVAADSQLGETFIGLLDWETRYIDPMVRPFYRPLRSFRLSPDGRWLAYLAGIRNLFGPPDRLDLLNVTNSGERTLIQLEAGAGLASPTWSPYLEQPRLALLAGSITAEDKLQPTRLLVTAPDRPDGYAIAAQAAAGEALAAPVFCGDGSLLYRTEQNGYYRLVRQSPQLPAQALFTADEPFWPLACP